MDKTLLRSCKLYTNIQQWRYFEKVVDGNTDKC